MSITIPQVTVDLMNSPPTGAAMLLTRLRQSDVSKVNTAANTLGMTQADFLRRALVGVAEAVIAESRALVEPESEPLTAG